MVSSSNSNMIFATDSTGGIYHFDVAMQKMVKDYNNLHQISIKAIEYIKNEDGEEFLCTGDLNRESKVGGYLKIFK